MSVEETQPGKRSIWDRLKVIGLAMVVSLFLAAVISQFLPSEVFVQAEKIVPANPPEIYDVVARPTTWKDWTAWNTERYPEMTWEYEGAEEGVGAIMSWSEPSQPSGRLEITAADSSPEVAQINYNLWFGGQSEPGTGQITIEKQGDGSSRVRWTGKLKLTRNPIERYMGLLLDDWIRQDFQMGLERLEKQFAAE
jgi:hypothetical protein